MGRFTDFVKQKLEEDDSGVKKVSSNLLKNIIDVLKEYVVTEYDLSEDEKMQIINNMEIGVVEHGEGVLKNSPKFIASSKYNETEGNAVPVEITVSLVTEKIGEKEEMEPAEPSEEENDEEIEDIDKGGEE